LSIAATEHIDLALAPATRLARRMWHPSTHYQFNNRYLRAQIECLWTIKTTNECTAINLLPNELLFELAAFLADLNANPPAGTAATATSTTSSPSTMRTFQQTPAATTTSTTGGRI
jgi:hypothetical protein